MNHNGTRREKVAVAVPVYREARTPDEEISYRHLHHYLGRYPIHYVVPERLDAAGLAGGKVVRFDDADFEDVNAYSRLLLSRRFYEAFAGYTYLLIYQLDCLVFSDELTTWCDKGYDYVGAPWFVVKNTPASGFSRVGNGGFSLRRVDACLRVIDSARYRAERVPFWRELLFADLQDVREQFGVPGRYVKKASVLRQVRRGAVPYMHQYRLNEDHFWADRARLFDPGFRIAPIDEALRFAFECAPRHCFAQAGGRLPFGAHAWARWDRAFWEPYLLT